MSGFIFLCLHHRNCGNGLKFSLSGVNRLVISALTLYSISIFLPWVYEERVLPSWILFRFYGRDNLWFWSFMERRNEEILLFGRFWFPGRAIPSYARWDGLYAGWILIFVLQILAVAYSTVYVLNWKVSERLRDYHSVWLVILPVLTLVFGVYQLFVQSEIMGRNLGLTLIRPHFGFAAAILSTAILLVAVRWAPEQSHLRTVPKAFKRTVKRTWPAIILFFIIALPLVAELQAQTGVSKAMLVENRKDFQEIYENPALWETHFNKISSLASLFRARIIHNRPDYAYCVLEVPVISYGILAALLNSLGYWTGENTPVRLLTSE